MSEAPRELKILSLRLLHGANYFSWEPVVWMRLDLGGFDEVFTHEIEGFGPLMQAAMPSLYDHHCSPGVAGGFLQRVAEGTLLGHVVEHVAIELQQLAGITVNFGKTRATGMPRLYNVLFEFLDDQAGLLAAEASVALINGWTRGEQGDVAAVIARLQQIRDERLLGPSTQALVDAATLRAIPWMRLDGENFVQLGTGCFQRRVRATLTSRTALIAYETALDKALSLQFLQDASVPVPRQIVSQDVAELVKYFHLFGGNVTVKPRQGALGRGVTSHVTDEAALSVAIEAARQIHADVILQPTLQGHNFRLLTIDTKMVAAVRLDPPMIAGDGASTIDKLVAELNQDPRRHIGDRGSLSRVTLDETSRRLLAAQGYAPGDILPAGMRIKLQMSGAMKLGGSAFDVTDKVHPETRALAERAARIIGLDVVGIDIIAEDIAQPLPPQGGAVIELGAAPDFRPHLFPTEGKSRPVAVHLIDSLFPAGKPDHARTISITGGDGATLAVEWLTACLKLRGHRVAHASKLGLFTPDTQLTQSDATGPEQARIALRDPDADHVVLETELAGILRGGLGYGLADIGVVLNFAPWTGRSDEVRLDHIEDQAYARAVVAEQVRKDGVAVLNADQYFVSEVRQRLQCKAIWFSRHPANRTVRSALRRGGEAIVIDKGLILLLSGRRAVTPLAPLESLLQGPAGTGPSSQIDIVLALSAILRWIGVPADEISATLITARQGQAL